MGVRIKMKGDRKRQKETEQWPVSHYSWAHVSHRLLCPCFPLDFLRLLFMFLCKLLQALW